MDHNEFSDFYRDILLSHCRSPRNYKKLQTPDVTNRVVNAFCGDEIDIQMSFDSGRISAIGIQAVGCSINQASASIAAEILAGKNVLEAKGIAQEFRQIMSSKEKKSDLDYLGDLGPLTEVKAFPVRVKCALLVWVAFQETVD